MSLGIQYRQRANLFFANIEAYLHQALKQRLGSVLPEPRDSKRSAGSKDKALKSALVCLCGPHFEVDLRCLLHKRLRTAAHSIASNLRSKNMRAYRLTFVVLLQKRTGNFALRSFRRACKAPGVGSEPMCIVPERSISKAFNLPQPSAAITTPREKTLASSRTLAWIQKRI